MVNSSSSSSTSLVPYRASVPSSASSSASSSHRVPLLCAFGKKFTVDEMLLLFLCLKCVGAIDGTHISASAPSGRTTAFRDRRSDITQNVMCACNFDMQFTYVHSGWKGSANDSRVMQDALGHAEYEFPWPPRGSYYLVDSGYAIGSAFLPPHKFARYHAQEFRNELFNYRHSSLRMVIERCFGVLKARFPILTKMHSFSISRQRLLVTACCALHNFIRMYNRVDEMFHVWEGSFVPNSDANPVGAERVGSGGTEEAFNARAQRAMSEYRDAITAAMWADYIGNRD
ncbi:hypothetical protein SO802_005410 [Lithocarpus litseifolius]|uniref:DDE Tnp4 domain-containing protein n=1 Tax=Lithocarpus litseifolius TaxID=425828 RepID=A0AAW2DII9_9ROSI